MPVGCVFVWVGENWDCVRGREKKRQIVVSVEILQAWGSACCAPTLMEIDG
jgi:hypothetical protein